MSSLTESAKRARMILSFNVFDSLLKRDRKSYSRKQLFGTFVAEKVGQEIGKDLADKELNKAKWQDAVLELATAHKILEKGRSVTGENVYCIGDELLLHALLDDWNDGSMILMSAMVFPNLSSVDFGNALSNKANKPDNNSIEIKAALAPATNESTPVRNNRLSRHPKSSQVPEVTFDAMAILKAYDELTETHKLLFNTISIFVESNKEMSARIGELEKKTGGANKRTETLERTVSELSAGIKKSLAAIASFDTAPSEKRIIDTITSTISNENANEQTNALRESIEVLAEQVADLTQKTEELSTISKANNNRNALLARLDNHLNESETLKELILSNIGDDNDPPGRTKATVRKRSA